MKILRYLCLVLIAGAVFLTYQIFSLTQSQEKVHIVVPLNLSQEAITQKLKAEGLIRSASLYNFLAAQLYQSQVIQPAGYFIEKRANIFEVLDILYNHPSEKWIVIAPGLRKEQVAERFTNKFNWGREEVEDFLANVNEGYSFPDTYLIDLKITGKEAAKKLTDNFNEKIQAKVYPEALKKNIRLETAVKIASLIQRESGTSEDKKLISGIIWNRLNIDMALQIDATIQYIMGSSTNWWPKVSVDDLKIDSSYNTYLIVGLPPGAIASPSLESLEAAVDPVETNCLFYLHDKQMKIHCSQTYEEHLANIQKYL